ncbi:MAG: TlpA disulfide reductase family protein [Candidatus Bathyarchaeia archaeon]
MANRSEKATRKSDRVRLSKAEKIAIPIILIIAIWVVYSATQPSIPSQTTTSSSTSHAGGPDFTLLDVVNGQPVTLSSFRGKIVFLEFMEPWCPHCQSMAPNLEKLYNQFGNKVVFISVAGPWNGPDGKPASAADAVNFINQYGSTWTYVYDSSGTVMNNEFGVTSTPTFFIIGKDGSILTSYTGEQSYDTLAAYLNSVS